MNRMRLQSSSLAFSLVEVLIAVAILASLALLAIPAYQGVVDAGDNASCINKLKRLGESALRYAYDHRGSMPSADWKQPNGRIRSGTLGSYSVRGSLLDYLSEWKRTTSPTEIAWCPADRRKHNKAIGTWQSYCLNTYAKGTGEFLEDGTSSESNTFLSPPIAGIPQPAQMAMFMDGVKPNITPNEVSYPSIIAPSTFINKQDSFYAHGDHLNVVYMDGHVGAVSRWEMRKMTSQDLFWSGGLSL